jgi:hypothetical protein
LVDRIDYFKKYYKDNKDSLAAYFKDKYTQEKNKRLTKAKEYYKINRDMILLKARLKSTDKSGHAYDIWKAVTKYAKKWKIPFVEWREFKEWAMTDPGYESVYQQWQAENFSKTYSPVAMRGVKKNGFVPENLKWDYKEQYSWWSQELQDIRQADVKSEEFRKVRNARTKEWRKKVRADWKAKQKDK